MRLFIGIAPDGKARQALARTVGLLEGLLPGRYVPPEQYHLTLAFLGEVPAKRLPALEEAMLDAVRGTPPFELRLAGIGRFGPVLWRGVEACPALDAVAERLRAALLADGFMPDPKPFKAHITLARDVRGGTDIGPPENAFASFCVQSISCYESCRVQGSLQYLPRLEVPF